MGSQILKYRYGLYLFNLNKKVLGDSPPQASKIMDSNKVVIKKTKKQGWGVFAKKDIPKGVVIASFDGPVYSWRSKKWTEDLYDHAIQFERYKWRDSKGIARLINHSCDANCGIKKLFSIVTMRSIKKGEELTWDYEMTENHPYWRMKCTCQSKNCRGTIGAYDRMPQEIRRRYRGYISSWLLKKNYILRKLQ